MRYLTRGLDVQPIPDVWQRFEFVHTYFLHIMLTNQRPYPIVIMYEDRDTIDPASVWVKAVPVGGAFEPTQFTGDTYPGGVITDDDGQMWMLLMLIQPNEPDVDSPPTAEDEQPV
jgi:hypothetical protein